MLVDVSWWISQLMNFVLRCTSMKFDVCYHIVSVVFGVINLNLAPYKPFNSQRRIWRLQLATFDSQIMKNCQKKIGWCPNQTWHCEVVHHDKRWQRCRATKIVQVEPRDTRKMAHEHLIDNLHWLTLMLKHHDIPVLKVFIHQRVCIYT